MDLSQYSDEELSALYKEAIQPQAESSPSSLGVKNNFVQDHPLWTDFGLRTVAPILGGALGTPLGPLGIAGGAALGTLGGNLASGYITNKPASTTTRDTITDLAFLAVPSAVRGGLGYAKNFRKPVPLGQFTTDTLNAFKNTGVDVLPTQISDGLGANFKSLNPQGYEQAADFFANQADQISGATERLTGQIGDIGADLTDNIASNIHGYQQGINDLYKTAGQEFGDVFTSGRDLYSKGLRLAKDLNKSNPIAAHEVQSFTSGPLKTVLRANNNQLTGQTLDDINKLVNNELKTQFFDPSKNKMISGYDDVNNAFTSTIKGLESKLNPVAATTKASARTAYSTQQELLKHLSNIGGSDIEKAFNAGFRSPVEFTKIVKQNPELIIDTFVKSQTPKETLDVLTKLGGTEIKPYLSNKLAAKVLSSVEDASGGVLNLAENTADPKKLVRGLDKYYGSLEALGGQKFANGILNQAKELAKVKYYTQGNPKMLASRAARLLGNETSVGNAAASVAGATGAALKNNPMGIMQHLQGLLPKGQQGSLNIFDYTSPEAIESLAKGYKPSSLDVLRYQTEFKPWWTGVQGIGLGLDYGITQRRY